MANGRPQTEQDILKLLQEIASGAPGGQANQSSQGAPSAQQDLGENQQLVQKEINKRKVAEINESLDSGIDPRLLQSNALKLDQTEQAPGINAALAGGQQQQQAAGGRNVLGDLGRFLFDPGQTQQGQEFRSPSLLGGLIKPTAANQLLLQQLSTLLNRSLGLSNPCLSSSLASFNAALDSF